MRDVIPSIVQTHPRQILQQQPYQSILDLDVPQGAGGGITVLQMSSGTRDDVLERVELQTPIRWMGQHQVTHLDISSNGNLIPELAPVHNDFQSQEIRDVRIATRKPEVYFQQESLVLPQSIRPSAWSPIVPESRQIHSEVP